MGTIIKASPQTKGRKEKATMENAKLLQLRREVRKVEYDTEKRKKICDEFFPDDPEDIEGERERCCCCKKIFSPGERHFYFQGWDGEYCDKCFCDEIERTIYRERGLNLDFGDEGGGTIWVNIEGEEPVVHGG